MPTYWVLGDYRDRFQPGLLPAAAPPMYSLVADIARMDFGSRALQEQHPQEYHCQAEGWILPHEASFWGQHRHGQGPDGASKDLSWQIRPHSRKCMAFHWYLSRKG